MHRYASSYSDLHYYILNLGRFSESINRIFQKDTPPKLRIFDKNEITDEMEI